MAQTPQRLTPRDKQRRRRRRIVSVVLFSVATLGLAWFFESRATTTILLVRHADTDAAMAAGGDPPLNARGVARAELLADFLEAIDVVASVDAIYASEFRRTQETAAPLAKRLNIEVRIADHYDTVGFMANVLHEHKGDIVLIVSHSDAIAPLIDELHGSKRLPAFGPNDYSDLYIITIPSFGRVKTLRLPYDVGWGLPDAGLAPFNGAG